MAADHAPPAPDASASARLAARPDPLAWWVFAVLVCACFAAFFVTQRLKHTPTIVQRFELTPRFTPSGAHRGDREERISFKLAKADEVTVTVVDLDGETVATLVRNHFVARYKQFSLRWNGRRGEPRGHRVITSPSGHRTLLPLNAGRLAPPGEYRIRVSLRHQGKQLLSPRTFALESP